MGEGRMATHGHIRFLEDGEEYQAHTTHDGYDTVKEILLIPKTIVAVEKSKYPGTWRLKQWREMYEEGNPSLRTLEEFFQFAIRMDFFDFSAVSLAHYLVFSKWYKWFVLPGPKYIFWDDEPDVTITIENPKDGHFGTQLIECSENLDWNGNKDLIETLNSEMAREEWKIKILSERSFRTNFGFMTLNELWREIGWVDGLL